MPAQADVGDRCRGVLDADSVAEQRRARLLRLVGGLLEKAQQDLPVEQQQAVAAALVMHAGEPLSEEASWIFDSLMRALQIGTAVFGDEAAVQLLTSSARQLAAGTSTII